MHLATLALALSSTLQLHLGDTSHGCPKFNSAAGETGWTAEVQQVGLHLAVLGPSCSMSVNGQWHPFSLTLILHHYLQHPATTRPGTPLATAILENPLKL